MDGSVHSLDATVVGRPAPLRLAFPARLADVLRPECRALPLVGRKPELDAVLEWLESGSGRVRVLAGHAGVGKSRLLAEVAALSRRRFLVADVTQAGDGEHLLRMTPDGLPLIVMTRHMQASASEFDALPIEPLDPAERAALFEAAYSAGASYSRRPAQPMRLTQVPDEAPEDLIMAGLIAPEIGAQAAAAMAPTDRAARIAAHEAQVLEESVRHAGLDPWPVRHVAACITHRGGASIKEATRLVEREAEAGMLRLHWVPEHLVDVLADLLQEGELLRPLAEGAAGRAFVRQTFACHDEPTRVAILARAARLPDCFTGSTLQGITVTDPHASCHFALESPG